MKNVFFVLAFMLVGTFAFATNFTPNENVNVSATSSIELSVDLTTNTSIEFVEIIEDCTWTKFTKITTETKYFLGIKISETTTTETVWLCV